MASGRPIFASKTTYDLLAVDSGEESEEELVEQPDVTLEQNVESSSEVPQKLSKSAIKKANRLTRIEKKQRQKAEKSRANGQGPASGDSVASESPSVSAPGSAINKPVELPDEVAPPTVAAHIISPLVVDTPIHTDKPTVIPNGDPHKPTVSLVAQLPVPPPRDAPTAKTSTAESMQAPKVAASIPIALHPVQPVAQPPRAPTHDIKQVALVEQKLPPQINDAERVKKRQAVLERTLWTLIMIGGFIGLLLMGHAYMILLVMVCQALVYKEVTALFSLKLATPETRDVEPMKGKDPWSKTLNWYFFAVTNYFLYGESIIYYFKHVVFADAQLLPFATNHRMISFTLYTIGFMGFVMSLKKGYLKQQFGLFCWVHMSLLLIVVSSHFIVNNILEGLIWFWVPASLVICNDVFAYIWGITIGRTPLIKLSPKKTVEGFVGAFWSTMIFGVLWGTYFMRFDYMICPVHDLGVSAWSSVACTPNPVFVWRDLQLWKPVAAFVSTLMGHSITTIPYAPYQLHLLCMSIFASLVAPFGGFFASGFKRAFNIKDFGHSIPGHGGMTDRMDCQFLMGIFTYVYYSSLIREHHVTVGSVLQTIVSGLSVNEQLELIADLRRYLEKQGIMVP